MTDAQDRAHLLLLETELFAEAGLGQLAATARMVARDNLELADQLEAERSGRQALQARCERQQELLGERVYLAAS